MIHILAVIDLDPATFVTIIGGTIAATGAVTIGFLKVVLPRLTKSTDGGDSKAKTPAACPISAESPIVLRDVTIHGVPHEVPAAFEARMGRIEQLVHRIFKAAELPHFYAVADTPLHNFPRSTRW